MPRLAVHRKGDIARPGWACCLTQQPRRVLSACPLLACADTARTKQCNAAPGLPSRLAWRAQAASWNVPGRRTMKATKPQFLPRLRCSSWRGHITLTLAIGPKRRNSRFRICACGSAPLAGRDGCACRAWHEQCTCTEAGREGSVSRQFCSLGDETTHQGCEARQLVQTSSAAPAGSCLGCAALAGRSCARQASHLLVDAGGQVANVQVGAVGVAVGQRAALVLGEDVKGRPVGRALAFELVPLRLLPAQRPGQGSVGGYRAHAFTSRL